MKRINCIISLVLAFLLISMLIGNSFAVTQSDAINKKNEIEETEKQLNEVNANLSSAMKDLQSLEGEIAEVEYTLNKLNNEVKNLVSEIEELEVKLSENEADYNERYESACARVIAQYKYGNISYLDVLLNSSGLTEFLSNYYLLGKILEADEELLEELEAEKEQIEDDKNELETKKVQLEAEKQQASKHKVTLANKKAEKEKKVATLSAEDKALQQAKEQYYAELAQIEAELARIAASASTSGGTYSGGSMSFPCPGYARVSSYFGSRTSPLAGASSYHKGVDLAAAKGTAVVASESGTVIVAYSGCSHNYGKSNSCGCGGGFGNHIMVNHGNGIVTVYAHLTSVNIGLGSKVNRGDVIGTVGSTGASSGAHLHFGVMQNGTYVDPAPYIGL